MKFHFGHKISFLKLRLYVKSRLVKLILYINSVKMRFNKLRLYTLQPLLYNIDIVAKFPIRHSHDRLSTFVYLNFLPIQ